MDSRLTVLERAFDLARRGANLIEIKNKLRAEGYENVEDQLQGSEIKPQLRAAEAAPVPGKLRRERSS